MLSKTSDDIPSRTAENVLNTKHDAEKNTLELTKALEHEKMARSQVKTTVG